MNQTIQKTMNNTTKHPFLHEHLAVIGAAGKMGAGIALVLLEERLRVEAEAFGQIVSTKPLLTLVDTSSEGLSKLKRYLREQLLRYTEKNIVLLRRYFANNDTLISNREIVDYFMEKGFESVQFTESLEALKHVTICFEAMSEDVEAKKSVYKQIDAIARSPPIYFSNTSAIPISILNEGGNLDGRIIGFHFYNPPPVQAVLEMVALPSSNNDLKNRALEIAKVLGKTVVNANDVAGFIGNGYLIREITTACALVQSLNPEYSLPQAVCMVEEVSREYLLRPMGVFQLVEYVGFDLVLKIGSIMNAYLPKPLYDETLVAFLKLCRPHFAESKIVGNLLGALPKGHMPWKSLSKDANRATKIQHYMAELQKETTIGSMLAKKMLKGTSDSADQLIKTQVAASYEDVDTVLKKGFYHLYGANEYGKL